MHVPARGWSAEGLLRPLWHEYDGGRDGLADAVGTQGSVLSSINTGRRNLGLDLAQRLAGACGITLADLGQPEPFERLRPLESFGAPASDALTRDVLDRLEALEAEVVRLAGGQDRLVKGVVRRLAVLEAAQNGTARPEDPPSSDRLA